MGKKENCIYPFSDYFPLGNTHLFKQKTC